MRTRSTKYKPLTASDYLLYNQMIVRLHTLEYAATHNFLRGVSDRKKMVAAVERQIQRTLKSLLTDQECECGYGMCQDKFKQCRPCGLPRDMEALIYETVQYIDTVGMEEAAKTMSELGRGSGGPGRGLSGRAVRPVRR